MSQEFNNPRPLWARAIFRSALVASRLWAHLRYEGQEHLPREGGFVLAANHQSYLDGLWILGGLSPEQFQRSTALAGADLSTQHGIIGKMIMKVGRPIAVERYGNPVRGLIVAKRAVQAGQIVLVHPEGTRTQTGFLGALQSGAAYLSIKAKAPLIPVYLSGAYDFFPRAARRPRWKVARTGKRPQLCVRFLDPMSPEDYTSAQELTAALAKRLYDAETRWLTSSEGWAASLVDAQHDWTKQARPELTSLTESGDDT